MTARRASPPQHLISHLITARTGRQGFMKLCREAHITGGECTGSTIELIFAQVDAPDAATAEEDRHNRSRLLNRQEYLQAIVRLSIEKFVKTKLCSDISDAVERLCRAHIARLPSGAVQNSNVFRTRYCYIERIDRVCRRHLPTLRALYDRYADVPGGRAGGTAVLDSRDLMSVSEWITFVTHIGLIESHQLTNVEVRHH